MTRTRMTVLAGLTIACAVMAAFLVAPAFHSLSHRPGRISPMWAERHDTLDGLMRGADAVVLASVDGIRPGRTVPMADGRPALPFTLVDLSVEETLAGTAGPTLTLERTGGEADGVAFYVDGDGGDYAVGDRVLLFLKEQPDTGLYYLVNPQGRFLVSGGRLDAADPEDPVARRLDQQTLSRALGILAEAG